MTRFDASDATDRRELFAATIGAHRERASAFCTFEADETHAEPLDAGANDADAGEAAAASGDAAGTDASDASSTGGAGGTGDASVDTAPPGAPGDVETAPPPWVQFAADTFNLDCTDAEFERLECVLDDYPEFRIDELERPETAEGVNVRITARSDANRLAGFVERAFRDVYDLPADYRVWVADV